MKRIRSNYRFIMAFNSALIALGLFGVLPPTATAMLHNLLIIAISLRSMSNVLDSSGRMSFGQFTGVQENKENTDGCGIEGYGVSGVKKLSPHITEKCNIGNGFFFKKAL